MKLLGICGSLRAASSNSRLLSAARALLPPGVEMHVTSCVAALPLFNPDVDHAQLESVRQWAGEMKAADGVVISTPEYARGYPGALKNALDWLVNTDAFVNKPFMLLGASSRSTVAQESLVTVLQTMSGIHVEGASTTLPLLGRNLEVADIVADQDFAGRIEKAMTAFVAELKRSRE
jgi:chromate reductase